MAPRLGNVLYWIGIIMACFWLLAFYVSLLLLTTGQHPDHDSAARAGILCGSLALLSYGMGYAARRALSEPPG